MLVTMEKEALFKFHGPLRDFYPLNRKPDWGTYRFTGSPAVKDAVEALGVPHPEVGAILLNGKSVRFKEPLTPGARVEVFAHAEAPPGTEPLLPAVAPPGLPVFVVDVHLGTLARALRLLGFDTVYAQEMPDAAIAAVAEREERVVLTRDVSLLKHRKVQWGYWLRSQHTRPQLEEVMRRYDLKPWYQPFTRCTVCNGTLTEVPKEAVQERLPPKTKLYFHEFFQCASCRRVYWKGSHYDRMRTFLGQLE